MSDWVCDKCTYINKNDRNVCEMCNNSNSNAFQSLFQSSSLFNNNFSNFPNFNDLGSSSTFSSTVTRTINGVTETKTITKDNDGKEHTKIQRQLGDKVQIVERAVDKDGETIRETKRLKHMGNININNDVGDMKVEEELVDENEMNTFENEWKNKFQEDNNLDSSNNISQPLIEDVEDGNINDKVAQIELPTVIEDDVDDDNNNNDKKDDDKNEEIDESLSSGVQIEELE